MTIPTAGSSLEGPPAPLPSLGLLDELHSHVTPFASSRCCCASAATAPRSERLFYCLPCSCWLGILQLQHGHDDVRSLVRLAIVSILAV